MIGENDLLRTLPILLLFYDIKNVLFLFNKEIDTEQKSDKRDDAEN